MNFLDGSLLHAKAKQEGYREQQMKKATLDTNIAEKVSSVQHRDTQEGFKTAVDTVPPPITTKGESEMKTGDEDVLYVSPVTWGKYTFLTMKEWEIEIPADMKAAQKTRYYRWYKRHSSKDHAAWSDYRSALLSDIDVEGTNGAPTRGKN
jgi:hypothetical protein